MKKRIQDILLYKRSVFEKLTNGKGLFYAGILAVGFLNMAFFAFERRNFFFARENPHMIYNIILCVLGMVLIGAMDVLFFSIPMNDLLRKFKREDKLPDRENRTVKIGKMYIMAHLPVLPLNIISFALYNNLAMDINNSLWYLVFIMDMLVPFWFAAVISRGINTIYNFIYIFKKMVFFVVFTWSFLLGYAITYMLSNWFILLLLSRG